MIKIHDIKPIIEIPDISIYIYYGLIVLLSILCGIVIYFIYQFFKTKPKTNEMKYYEILQNLDFKNPKKTAYQISKYGRLLAQDERQIILFEELTNDLFIYKYKKEIDVKFSENIKNKFDIFMDALDVK